MELETIPVSIADGMEGAGQSEAVTELEAETEGQISPESASEAGLDAAAQSEAETQSLDSRDGDLTGSVPEAFEGSPESEAEADVFSAPEEEVETSGLKEESSKEASFLYPASGYGSSGSSNVMDQLDAFTYSEEDPDAALYWQENIAACRGSLASCVSLLLFADVMLCLLVGCLCASIFSRFWKVNR